MGFLPDSSRRRAPGRPAALALLGCLLLGGGELLASPDTERGLDLIHQGKIRDGRRMLHAHARAHPQDAEAQFYAGVASWWQHIAELGHEKAGKDAVAFFDAGLAVGFDESTAQGQFLAGTSLILKGHLEGAQGSILGAAFSARRGKKLLDAAFRNDPSNHDVGFALGAYDYYADRLPSIVKGLRAILFLPGGNAARGMRELESAARKGKVFDCEASLVLADIYGSNLEDKYDISLELMESLVARYPDNPFFLAGRAEVESEIGDFDRALADMKAALAQVPEDDPMLRAGLGFQEARILDRSHASEMARQRLEPMVAASKGVLPAGQHVRMRYLLGEVLEKLGERERALAMFRELGGEELDARMKKRVSKKLANGLSKVRPSYRDAQPAITALRGGQPEEAVQQLRGLHEASPEDPVLLFFLGEALLATGKSDDAGLLYDEARKHCNADEGWIQGYTLVRNGDIAVSSGDRKLALERYRQAAGVEKWPGRGGIVAYRLARVASTPAPAEKKVGAVAPEGAAPGTSSGSAAVASR